MILEEKRKATQAVRNEKKNTTCFFFQPPSFFFLWLLFSRVHQIEYFIPCLCERNSGGRFRLTWEFIAFAKVENIEIRQDQGSVLASGFGLARKPWTEIRKP